MPWWQPDWALEDRSLFQPTALEHFDRVIDDSACQEELSEPFLEEGETCELWREQNFEVLLDDHWTSGTIDRVAIVRDEKGNALSARILDFKTDEIADEKDAHQKAQSYQPQMKTYRVATSILLNLPPEKVKTSLLFTANSFLVETT